MKVDMTALEQLLNDLDAACTSVDSAEVCISSGDNMSSIKSNTTITNAIANAKSAKEEISSSLEEIQKKQSEISAILTGENLEYCSNWNGFGLNEVDIDTNRDRMYTYEEFVAAYNLDQKFFESSYNQNNQQLLFDLKLRFDDLRGDKFPNLLMHRLDTYFYCANRHRMYSDDFNYDSRNNMYRDYTAFGYIYSRENENNPNFNVSNIGSVCLNMSHEQINDYSNNYLNNYDYEASGIPDLYWNNAETPMDKVNLIISYTGDEDIPYHFKDNRDNVETELARFEKVAANILEMGYFFDYDTYNSMYDPKYQEIAGPMLTSSGNELRQYAQMISDVDYLFNECVNDDGTLKSPDEVTPMIKDIIKNMREPNNNLTGNIEAYVNIPISSNVDKDKVWLDTLIELGYIDTEFAKNIDLSDENNEYTIRYKNTYGSTRFLQALYNEDENGEENVLGFLSELYTNCGLSETKINELEYCNTQDILYCLDSLNLYDESLDDVYNLFGNWLNNYSTIRYNEQQSIFVNLKKLDTTTVTDNQLAEGMDSLGINKREMELLGKDYVRGYALAYAESPDDDLTIQLKNELLDLLKHNKAKNNAKNIIRTTNDATGTSLGALSVPVDFLIGTLSMPLVGGYYGGGNFLGGLWNLAFADGEVSQFELEQSYLNTYLNADYSAFADFNQSDYEIMTSSDYEGIENLSVTDKIIYSLENVPRYRVLYELGQISEEEYDKYCLYHNTEIEDCEFYKQVNGCEFRSWTNGVYNVSSSLTQSGIPVAISWLTKNPKLGSLLQAGSVAGSSREQMMQSGETNDGLIWLYSFLKGGTAYFTENIGGLMSAHADDIPPSILKMITDELGEELIQYPVDMVLDVGFKQRDFPNPEEFKKEMKDTIFLTSVSTLILGCGSNSIQRNQQRTVQLNDGYTYTASYNEAMKFKNSDGTFDQDGFVKFLKENGRFKTDDNTLLQTVNEKYGEGYATDIELTEDGFKYTTKDGTIVECDMFGIPKVVKANSEDVNVEKESNIFEDIKALMDKYGADQGSLTNLFEKNRDLYTYIREKMVKIYNINANYVDVILNLIDSNTTGGACPTAAHAIVIIQAFENASEKFQDGFGFPLYIEETDGSKRLNVEELMIDMIFSNPRLLDCINNNESILCRDSDGKIMYRQGQNLRDFTSSMGFAYYNLYNYLKSKIPEISMKSDVHFLRYNGWGSDVPNTVVIFDGKNQYSSSRSEMIQKLLEVKKNNGNLVSVVKGTQNNPIPFIDMNNNEVLTNFVGHHWIKVTDVTNDGIVASSWGYKVFISFDDLLKENNGFDFFNFRIDLK